MSTKRYLSDSNNGGSPRKRRKEHVQLILDVGQKKFGNLVCQVCGMVYNYDQELDKKQHKRYCRKFCTATGTHPIVFRGWKTERVVDMCDGSGKERIIVVEQSDSRSHVNRVKEIVGVPIDAWSKVYLYISAKQVVGYAVTETSQSCDDDLTDQENGVNPLSDTAEDAHVAVSNVWVEQSHRKSGILTRLLDAVRSSYFPGRVIPKEKMTILCPVATEEEY